MSADAVIWDKFRRGEKSALEEIYFHNVQFLYRYGRKFNTDDDLLKDTIHDLFIDLIQSRKTLGPTDNVKFYLMRSFRRKLVQNIRKSQLNTIESLQEFTPEITYSAEEDLITLESRSEQDIKIRQCLSELNPRQREILYYRFECEFSYEQICEIMSIKYDSARKLVFRSIESLRQMFIETHTIQFFLAFFKRI
ncbi:MAG TPA: hypothetical protein DCY35_09900 [Prolixibacteraceae bacterium]|nr:hypothetical protein [Prolixibacteraceae bacterium]